MKLLLSVDRDKELGSKKIIKKDTCSFCNIKMGEYSKNIIKNNEAHEACSLCFYTENLDKITTIEKGTIILLPEISQVELFSILRMSWFIESIEDKLINTKYEDIIDSNKNILMQLKERQDYAKTYYAQGIENLDILINFLHTISDEKYKLREKGLLYLRWLPPKENFKDEIKFWNNNEFKKYNPKNFKTFIKNVSKELSKRK